MKERIQKVLGNAGVASRRAIEAMVLDGRIAVNGQIVTELPVLIDPEKDKVLVDGELIRLKGSLANRRIYLLMNKPKDVVCTNVAQGAQVRAIDLLPKEFQARVYPVARLDADSKGLLLLTNDGDLTNRLTHPRYGITKLYRAIVEGNVSPATVEQMQKGVYLIDPKTGRGSRAGATHVKILKHLKERTVLEITLREGRNRQIQRTLAKLGHKVRELTRVRLGPLNLEGLDVGEFRELTPKEVKALQHEARADRAPKRAGK